MAASAAPAPLPASARKIGIIGAGFAGLGAAQLLKLQSRHALDVTVLESSQRVGGRACTLQVPKQSSSHKQYLQSPAL